MSDTIQAQEEIFGLVLKPAQRDLLKTYLALLRQWNRRLALVSRRLEEEEVLRLVFEGLWLAEHFLPGALRVADIGSGAGLPGIAAAIMNPSLRVTLIERNFRKTVFLKEATRRLGLKVQIFPGDAQEFPGWDAIDVATLRALRPGADLIRTLKLHRVSLLWLHTGNQTLCGFESVQERAVPASRRGRATLFVPSGSSL